MTGLGKKTLSNATAGVVEQIVIGLSMLLFYGFLSRVSSLNDLGVMSLVLTISAIAQTSNLGLGASLLRFVPEMEGRNDRKASVSYVQTAIIITTLFFVLFSAIIYVPFQYFVLMSVGVDDKGLVSNLYLPSILYVVVLNISIVTQSALAAFQLSPYRVLISIAAAAVSLAVAVLAFPQFGLASAVWALLIQATITLVLGWAVLWREARELPMIPHQVDLAKAKDLAFLGGKIQLLSICLLAGEPLTRLLIGAFGHTEQVALFALAWRVVVQVRGLVYSASSALVPALGYSTAHGPEFRDRIYRQFNACIGVVALPLMLGVVAVAPHFGALWLKTDDPSFATMVLIIVVGLLPSTLTLGAFQFAVSAGIMRANLTSHVALVIGNSILGPLLAYYFGGVGATIALAISMALIGLLGFPGNAKILGLSKHGFEVFADLCLGLVAAVAIAIIWYRVPEIFLGTGWTQLSLFIVSGFVFGVLVGAACWLHPARRAVFGIIFPGDKNK